jgi:trehalose 6-phosphate phosphatase
VEHLAALRRDPTRAAIVLDIDGTLAPIAPHPDRAGVPAATLQLLGTLAGRYGLVACVSGRAAVDAARLVPVDGLVISGNHGLETMTAGRVHVAPDAAVWLPELHRLARELVPVAAAAGGWVEDKGATLSIHYREAPDPDAARDALERDAVPTVRAAGLVARFGRMTLEVLPPIPIDKGSAVRRLLLHRHIAASLYAGDDTTDIDAFRVVDVAVAVRSAEMPPGLVEAATFAVDGTDGVTELLRRLAE